MPIAKSGNPVRCQWTSDDLQMIEYHDKEWGVPVHDDKLIFEFLVLEGMQAGLSWSTVLHKRGNFRKAFAGFSVEKVARFDRKKIDSLMKDPGIIRNRLKILAAINNAKMLINVKEEFGSFDNYIWQFVGGVSKVNRFKTLKSVPATSRESDSMSKDLRSRGFKFVGSTICYAHMQATGMVNDHLLTCFRHDELLP